jgi:hypothetical protein
MATSPSLASGSAPAAPAGVGGFAKFAYFVMFVGLLGLAATGIGTFALGQAPMTHWVLMGHVGGSPMFTIGLTLVALTWPARLDAHAGFARCLFWLLLLAGVGVVLTGVIPMTPIFGTHGQHLLYLSHRYGAIALTAIAVLHLFALGLRARR